MQALRHTVLQVIDVERRGGQLMQRDSHTLLVSGLGETSQSSLALIADQHPLVEICTIASPQSGYILCFTLWPRVPLLTSASFVHMALVLALVAGSTAHFGLAAPFRFW